MTMLLFLCAIFFVFPVQSFSERLSSTKYNYTIDLPEGFEISDSEKDGTAYIFSHTLLPVSVLIRIWPHVECKNAREATETTFARLNAKSEDSSDFFWRGKLAQLVRFSMMNAAYSEKQCGWSLACPLFAGDAVLVLAAYSKSENSLECEQMILSVLDSLMIDNAGFRDEGAISTFAYPPMKTEKFFVNIAGKSISVPIDKMDSEAERSLIDREFTVFKIFFQTPLWKNAWQRFYRVILKSSCNRLKNASIAIHSALFKECEKLNPENPNAAYAQMLLTWIQGQRYERVSFDVQNADLAPATDVLFGKGGDCDGRAILLAILLENVGIKSCIFVSEAYSHAILGVALEGAQGFSINVGGTNYLVGETTAKGVTLGKIDSSMREKYKWIPVEF